MANELKTERLEEMNFLIFFYTCKKASFGSHVCEGVVKKARAN